MRGRDSGSAAAPIVWMRGYGYAAPFNNTYMTLELGSVVNDAQRDTLGIVPVDHPWWYASDAAPQFRIGIQATGVGTFDAFLAIAGIIT